MLISLIVVKTRFVYGYLRKFVNLIFNMVT